MRNLLFAFILLFAQSSFSQSGEGRLESEDLDNAINETSESLANLGGLSATKGALKDSYITNLLSSAHKEILSDFLSENPFSKVSEAQMKALISARLAGLPFGNFLEGHPKYMDAFVEFLRHERALPNLIGIVNQPEKVKQFGYIAIGVFVAVFILNLFNSKGNIFKRILRKLTIGLGAFCVNLGAFYFIFREEIQPTLNIIFKHFHL